MEAVAFKGTKKGLLVQVRENAPFEEVKNALVRKMEAGRNFFVGSRPVVIIEGRLDRQHRDELTALITERLDVERVEFSSGKLPPSRPGMPYKEVQALDWPDFVLKQEIEMRANDPQPVRETGECLFVRRTVRDGEKLSSDGHIVVIGNVEEDGEVNARGSIVVLGTLRGRAHAGLQGDERAVIAAGSLMASELSIASSVGRFFADDLQPVSPQWVKVQDGQLVVESAI
ncbi:septum site-determining protein MinC [Gehongia tenuis]|uniref:Probable septum site-determining protein MinC n=1 Tax=Gehongia tenuis TaxID=2763655 RepID=A0A926D4F4_9FIRM|nr:septum site-determining protein MinC [Gehongia tenuis]MBC8531548.1 septum site-determining protein MinC [Gehongia tenuis]